MTHHRSAEEGRYAPICGEGSEPNPKVITHVVALGGVAVVEAALLRSLAPSTSLARRPGVGC